MLRLVVREHERIPVVDERQLGERAITTRELDELFGLCETYDVAALSAGFHSVKFANYCGLIQVAGVSIEILPKIADEDAFDRSVLLKMVEIAERFSLERIDTQQVAMQSHSFLHALIRWYCNEVFAQCHVGLLRQYVVEENDLPVIRGRWRPDVDARRFPGRKDRLNCEFDELTTDNPYNRILKAALTRVRGLARGDESLEKDISLLLNWFSGVSDVSVSFDDVSRLPNNRLVARYKKALQMASWFIGKRSPEIRTGKHDAISLLFDMNALFQAFLAQIIRRALPPEFYLREEGPRHHLTVDYDGNRRFQMKPDICILNDQRVVAIIDAKWKILDPESIDGKWGIQQADIYQLHAYSFAYRCKRVALWYPAPSFPSKIKPTFTFVQLGDQASESSVDIDWISFPNIGQANNWISELVSTARLALTRLDISNQAVNPSEAV